MEADAKGYHRVTALRDCDAQTTTAAGTYVVLAKRDGPRSRIDVRVARRGARALVEEKLAEMAAILESATAAAAATEPHPEGALESAASATATTTTALVPLDARALSIVCAVRELREKISARVAEMPEGTSHQRLKKQRAKELALSLGGESGETIFPAVLDQYRESIRRLRRREVVCADSRPSIRNSQRNKHRCAASEWTAVQVIGPVKSIEQADEIERAMEMPDDAFFSNPRDGPPHGDQTHQSNCPCAAVGEEAAAPSPETIIIAMAARGEAIANALGLDVYADMDAVFSAPCFAESCGIIRLS
jgi:hypothetical protein